MRHHNYPYIINILLGCMLLASCAPGVRSGNVWDSMDYAHIAAHHARDYDADYSLPSTAGCMDDAPDCQ